MILAVDVGNTHTVFGGVDGDNVSTIARMRTDALKTEYEYAVLIRQTMDFSGVDPRGFDGVIISSVVPPVTHTLERAIKKVTGLDSLVVGSGIKTGLNILIDNPAQLGGDLVAGAVAALGLEKPPLIIIDMGTATTISVIDKKGNFIGCAIAPGVNLSVSVLASGTSQLPKVSIEAPRHCVGKNTVDSMKSGVVFGAASMLDGMIDRIEQELGYETTVLATGGLAPSIVGYCRRRIRVCDDLLLRGLAMIYEKNHREKG